MGAHEQASIVGACQWDTNMQKETAFIILVAHFGRTEAARRMAQVQDKPSGNVAIPLGNGTAIIYRPTGFADNKRSTWAIEYR
jgi:hypothetical protein